MKVSHSRAWCFTSEDVELSVKIWFDTEAEILLWHVKFHQKFPDQNTIFHKITGSRILEPLLLLWEYKIIKNGTSQNKLFLMRDFAFPLAKGEAWGPFSISSHKRKPPWRFQIETISPVLQTQVNGAWLMSEKANTTFELGVWLLPGKIQRPRKRQMDCLGAELKNITAMR